MKDYNFEEVEFGSDETSSELVSTNKSYSDEATDIRFASKKTSKRDDAIISSKKEEAEIKAKQKALEIAKNNELIKNIAQKEFHIIFHYVAVAILSVILILEVFVVGKTTLIDTAKSYLKSGCQIVLLNEKHLDPYFYFIEGNDLKLRKKGKIKKILSFGKDIPIVELNLRISPGGGLTVEKNTINRTINLFKNIRIYELYSGSSFIIMDKSAHTNGVLSNLCYYSTEKAEEPIKLKNVNIGTDSSGARCFYFYLSANLLETNKNFFSSQYKASTLKKFKEYFDFKARVYLYRDGTCKVNGDVDFSKFERKYNVNSVGSNAQMRELCVDFDDIISNRLTSKQISKLFNVTGTLKRHHGYNNQYTFVIKKLDNADDKAKVGLYWVDNYNSRYGLITKALSVEFQSNRIKVEKYDTFLLFFDSSETVYYDYYGNKM